MSDIGKAREFLKEAYALTAEDDVAKLIKKAISLMTREKNVERTEQTSRSMSASIVRTIKSMKRSDPDLPLQEIAQAVAVNAGRVSETLAGKWDHLLR